MKYIYETYVDNVRVATNTSFEQALAETAKYVKSLVLVYDAEKGSNLPVFSINTREDEAEWRRKLEQDSAWIGKKAAVKWDPTKDLLDDHVKKEKEPDALDIDVVKTNINLAVDPSHYKGYIEEFQWIDAMSRIPTMRDPEKFIAALELQVRKYLDRRGQKDKDYQEMGKALFYLEYLRQFIGFAYHGYDRPTADSVHQKLKD